MHKTIKGLSDFASLTLLKSLSIKTDPKPLSRNHTRITKSRAVSSVVWGISLLLSKEQGLWIQVSVVYCISIFRCAQDTKALVSRGDAMLLG